MKKKSPLDITQHNNGTTAHYFLWFVAPEQLSTGQSGRSHWNCAPQPRLRQQRKLCSSLRTVFSLIIHNKLAFLFSFFPDGKVSYSQKDEEKVLVREHFDEELNCAPSKPLCSDATLKPSPSRTGGVSKEQPSRLGSNRIWHGGEDTAFIFNETPLRRLSRL